MTRTWARAGARGMAALACAATPAASQAPVRPPIPSVSHVAVYAADPARSERFYVHDLGAAKRPDPEDPRGVRYYFNPLQYVEVLPLPPGGSINRLDHVGLNTPDAEAMRRYLQAKGATVPAAVRAWADGSRSFRAVDPEGNRVEFVQPPVHPAAVPANPLSAHMIHFGFIVHDRIAQDRFYRGLLGFRPYWAGGMTDTKPVWISLQVPDGTDWMEYMVVGKPDGHGIPADMGQANLGVLNHFALGITDARQAYTLLWNGDRLRGQDQLPKIGRDAKWQLNLLDPDGTRAELMELHAIGKPCCSPFTAPDPAR